MPKHPVYVAMLPESARTAIGMPHPNGRPAMRMLENEGFAYEGYVDIFDGGPTMTARTDQVRSIAQAHAEPVAQIAPPEGIAAESRSPIRQALVATGRLASFRCTLADVADGQDGLILSPGAATALAVREGDTVWHVAR
jgi:arginine N-succinyltransferase